MFCSRNILCKYILQKGTLLELIKLSSVLYILVPQSNAPVYSEYYIQAVSQVMYQINRQNTVQYHL